VKIARRTHSIARQSIVAGMALSGVMTSRGGGCWLTPVAAALTQEAIDVMVILNALRALFSAKGHVARLPFRQRRCGTIMTRWSTI
jgi:cation transport ATPase